ncbi:hypothetical protein [Pedobacter heparinus]|nr:hypothetical protein [Pedobacter heparinus]
MKNVRWIILFSVLSLFSGVFPVGLSTFKAQKHITERVWSARKESVSRRAGYHWLQIQTAKPPLHGTLSANHCTALLHYAQLTGVRFIHQQEQFKELKTSVLMVILFTPAAKYPCRPAFG